MKSPIQKRANRIKEVSIPSLNFQSELRTMKHLEELAKEVAFTFMFLFLF